jgi:hypothetical protein
LAQLKISHATHLYFLWLAVIAGSSSHKQKCEIC